tara:strand:- start:383 stop:970 length:588 start_codon:yes stop_codon:yes gene_type:complete
MKMRKKIRKFQDGGETEFESKQGENPGISDDIRARAMKYVQEQNEPSSELVKEPPVAKTKTVKKAAPKAEPKTTTSRPPEEKGLERVGVEDLLPIGKAAAALGAGYTAARMLGKKMLSSRVKKEAGERSAKEAEAVSKLPKKEQDARKERYMSTGPMEDAFGKGTQFKREFKSGGKISSASKRADGCAVRGKTRA